MNMHTHTQYCYIKGLKNLGNILKLKYLILKMLLASNPRDLIYHKTGN